MKVLNTRDNKKENFDKGRIISSINKAIEAVGYEPTESDDLIVAGIADRLYQSYK
jgi:transcriptional regulator NrdR family protein